MLFLLGRLLDWSHRTSNISSICCLSRTLSTLVQSLKTDSFEVSDTTSPSDDTGEVIMKSSDELARSSSHRAVVTFICQQVSSVCDFNHRWLVVKVVRKVAHICCLSGGNKVITHTQMQMRERCFFFSFIWLITLHLSLTLWWLCTEKNTSVHYQHLSSCCCSRHCCWRQLTIWGYNRQRLNVVMMSDDDSDTGRPQQKQKKPSDLQSFHWYRLRRHT